MLPPERRVEALAARSGLGSWWIANWAEPPEAAAAAATPGGCPAMLAATALLTPERVSW